MTEPDGTDTAGEDGGGGGEGPTRCGFVALVGAPNAGKSTLVNALVGAKVSIVTHKVQTTRSIVRGIALHGPAQVVLVDMPGVFDPKKRLERAMVDIAWMNAREADAVAVLVDAKRGVDEHVEALVERCRDIRSPKLLVLTKVDTVKKPLLLELAARLNAIVPFEETFMVSAVKDIGLDELMDAFAARMPEGPWLYPEDQVSDLPLRQLAAEVTREHLMRRLHQELPYGLTVETEAWTEHRDGSVRIEQTIITERDSHKRIIIGKGGANLKAISMAARGEIAGMIERPVHLILFVKVRERWQDDPDRYRNMNLDFPRG